MHIFHNVLNLPECVKQNGTTQATYVYLADGTKAEVYTGGNPGTGSGYSYLGSLRYTRTGNTRQLESTPFAAGRFVKNTGGMQPYYHITDHLGSIRVITDKNGTMQEENDYYPYEARMYDNVTGRWGTPDPLTEKYKSMSPYNYCLNNPVMFVDPDGRKVWILFNKKINGKTTQERVQYKNGKLYGIDGKEYAGSNKYPVKVLNDLNKLLSSDDILKSRLNDLVGSNNIHTIEMVANSHDGNSNTPLSQSNDEKGIPTGSKTKYNPDKNETVRGDKRDAKVGLAHELLGHGWDSDKGKTNYNKTYNGIPMYEVNAVNIENRARASAGNEIKTTYGGKPIPTILLFDINKNKK